jgi:hypothetical protein
MCNWRYSKYPVFYNQARHELWPIHADKHTVHFSLGLLPVYITETIVAKCFVKILINGGSNKYQTH